MKANDDLPTDLTLVDKCKNYQEYLSNFLEENFMDLTYNDSIYIIKHMKLNDHLIEKFLTIRSENVRGTICEYHQLSKKLILKYFHRFNLLDLIQYQKAFSKTYYKKKAFDEIPEFILSDDDILLKILENSYEDIDFRNYKLDPNGIDMLLKRRGAKYFYYALRYQNFSEKILEKYISNFNYLDLITMQQYQILSKDFINKHLLKLDKNIILNFQDIAEKDLIG